MKKIVIFGTGSSATDFVERLDYTKMKIMYFLDNNIEKHSEKFLGFHIYSPQFLKENTEYDYIFIASQFSNEIFEQLLGLGVPFNKIIPTNFVYYNNKSRQKQEEIYNSVTVIKEVSNMNKAKIALINYNYSNYNGYAMYKKIPSYIKEKYTVDLLEEPDLKELRNYDVICSSHYDGIYNGKHINIELWHGFPIKQMGVMHDNSVNDESILYYNNRSEKTNLIMSYSQLYTTFLNSCFPSDAKKYRVTGMPRNDLLFDKEGLSKLEILTNKSLNDKNIVFYLPTWRKGKNNKIETSRSWSTLFGFNDENENNIIRILEENNLYLVVKLHPFEFNLYKNLALFKHDRIYLLSDEVMYSQKIHLYELLGSAKMLITDYSSVFFDTLLIDLPIIFAPTDLDEYSENRGFLIEPYDILTPGPTVHSLKDLEDQIKLLLKNSNLYKRERDFVKKLVFKYTDNNSSLRVWAEIDNLISKLKVQQSKKIIEEKL